MAIISAIGLVVVFILAVGVSLLPILKLQGDEGMLPEEIAEEPRELITGTLTGVGVGLLFGVFAPLFFEVDGFWLVALRCLGVSIGCAIGVSSAMSLKLGNILGGAFALLMAAALIHFVFRAASPDIHLLPKIWIFILLVLAAVVSAIGIGEAGTGGRYPPMPAELDSPLKQLSGLIALVLSVLEFLNVIYDYWSVFLGI